MPFARATYNGVTGLLKKGANFVKACCCKKWACDPFTQTCSEDPSGTYNSEQECNDNCKRYACDTGTYTCIEDPTGPYSNYDECMKQCKEKKFYCCGSPGSPEDRDCYSQPCDELGLDEFGVYDTQGQCDDECKKPHYDCDPSTYTCVEDPAGPYTDSAECAKNCQPGRYRCTSTDACEEHPAGPYDDYFQCLGNAPVDCKEPLKWSCITTDQCETSDVGVYYSEEDCLRNAPTDCPEKWRCIDTSTCEQHNEGKYDSESECVDAAPSDCELLWVCVEPDACEQRTSQDGGVYTDEGDCLSNAPNDCKKKYTCRANDDGSKTCVEDPSGEYDTDDCGGECKPARYDCVENAEGVKECVEKEGGPYKTDDCDKVCDKPKKYKCVDNPDGTKSCVEDPDGPYDKDDCGGECAPKTYACKAGADGATVCVEDPAGPHKKDDCNGECAKKKYSCIENPDGSKTCIEDNLNGVYESDDCAGECKPKKYKCSRLPDGTYECVEDPNGPYDKPDCNGECSDAFTGWCCTEYGASSVSRKQCDDWGGDFYTDFFEAQAACPCDCNGIGGTVSTPNVCVEVAEWTTCAGTVGEYCKTEAGYQQSWPGTTPTFPNDDPAGLLDDIRAKGARIIGWIDDGLTVAYKPGDQENTTACCIINASRSVRKHRTFALNCRKGEWEEVANVLAQYDYETVGGTGGSGATCNGVVIQAEENPVPPPVQFVPSAPTCLKPAPNPLP